MVLFMFRCEWPYIQYSIRLLAIKSLGDFCLGGAEEWNKILDRLNGRIYLVLGNHDLKNIRQGFIDRFEHVAMAMCIQVGKKKI